MSPNVIDTVLFDLGGLIEHVDPNLVVNAFKQLGMKNPQYFFTLSGQSTICNELEIGNISKQAFIEHIRSYCRPGTTHEAVINAWNANLLGIPLHALGTIQTLKNRGFSLYILSNTNAIHAEKIIEQCYRQYRLNFHSLFDKVYFSHEIGHRKPNEAFFQHVLDDAKLEPHQCLFIDDLAKNLEPARQLGIHVAEHETNQPIAYFPALLKQINAMSTLHLPRNIAQ
jgi:glucose-1-phosphatase